MVHRRQECLEWHPPFHPHHPRFFHTPHQASDAARTTANWRGSMAGPPWDTPFSSTPSNHTLQEVQCWQGQPQQPPPAPSRPPEAALQSLTINDVNDVKMATLPDDFQEQQDAARDYEPAFQGPNVSPRKSTQELVARYASSDGAYTQKALALSLTHSQFRTVVGDGNCGWRAVFFTFCETLLLLGEVSNIQRHHKRLQKETQNLRLIGDEFPGLYEEMNEELEDLFKCMPGWLSSANPVSELEQFFNQESRTVHLIYCLRLLTSGHMRANKDAYEAFCENGVHAYCSNVIEKLDEEIEEPGVRALCDLLLVPAGIGLRVVNLQNSPGPAADTITYHTPTHHAVGGPFSDDHPPEVQVLYTPGHYDIIYQSCQHAMTHRGGGHDITVNAVMAVPYAGQYSQASTFSLSQPIDVNLEPWMPSGFLPQQTLQPSVNNDQTVFSSKESTMDFQPHPSSSYAPKPLPAANSSLITPMATPSPTPGLILPQHPHPPSGPLFTCADSQPVLSPRHDVPFTLLSAVDGPGQMVPNPPQTFREAPPARQPNPRKRERQCLSSVGWDSECNLGHFRNEDFDPTVKGIGLTPEDFERPPTPKKPRKRKTKDSSGKVGKNHSRGKK